MGSKSKSKPNPKASTSTNPSGITSKRTRQSSSWYYVLAILPLFFFLLASQLLRTTLPPPPSDFGSGSMFDQIAPRYDFINRALALNLDMSWRHRLVKEVVGADGELFKDLTKNDKRQVKILDLATGTADVAILLGKVASQYDPTPSSSQFQVLGVDPSQNMINVGISKVKQYSLSDIVRLELGDSRKLDSIEDNTFDAATMSFGIRNVPEKEMALCEIHRVLKKAAFSSSFNPKLAIMEFSEPGPDSGIMGSLARIFIRHVVPSLGALLSGAPKEYMHLQNSIKDFPSPSEFVTLMEGLRCPVKADNGEELDLGTFGAYRVKEVIHLNFGSVQIYVAFPILKKYVTK